MVPTVNDYQELQQSDRNVKIVDGSLIIKNIQKNHEGYYLCKASNGIGGISAVAKISVQGMYENFSFFKLRMFFFMQVCSVST